MMETRIVRNLSEEEFDRICDVAERGIEAAKNYQLLYEMLFPLYEASQKLFHAPTRLSEVQALQELRKATLNCEQVLEEKDTP